LIVYQIAVVPSLKRWEDIRLPSQHSLIRRAVVDDCERVLGKEYY
jgi:hypothetical protein